MQILSAFTYDTKSSHEVSLKSNQQVLRIRVNTIHTYSTYIMLTEHDVCAICVNNIHYRSINIAKFINQTMQVIWTSISNTFSSHEVSLKSDRYLLRIRMDKCATERTDGQTDERADKAAATCYPQILRGIKQFISDKRI